MYRDGSDPIPTKKMMENARAAAFLCPYCVVEPVLSAREGIEIDYWPKCFRACSTEAHRR